MEPEDLGRLLQALEGIYSELQDLNTIVRRTLDFPISVEIKEARR